MNLFTCRVNGLLQIRIEFEVCLSTLPVSALRKKRVCRGVYASLNEGTSIGTSVCWSVGPSIRLSVRPSVRPLILLLRAFLLSHQKWEKRVKNVYLCLCNRFLLIFHSQSLFFKLSFQSLQDIERYVVCSRACFFQEQF